jgi:hypothetical protein
MTRRELVMAASAAGIAPAAMQTNPSPRHYFELTYYWCRNSADGQVARITEYLKDAMAPASGKAGVAGHGYFANLIAPDGPFVVSLTGFPSLGSIEDLKRRIFSDPAVQKGLAKLNGTPGLSYTRMETSLLRGFPGFPAIETPKPAEALRVFELRTYESDNFLTLGKKITMFDSGETAIFRRLGMQPVFFGEMIYGRRMPNLTYLLGYDSLAHREAVWKAFAADPEWAKMRGTPGMSDAEIVSNIGATLLRPLPFSPIR